MTTIIKLWEFLRDTKGYLWRPKAKPHIYDYTAYNFAVYDEDLAEVIIQKGNIVDVVFGLYEEGIRGTYIFRLAHNYSYMTIDIEQFVQDVLDFAV